MQISRSPKSSMDILSPKAQTTRSLHQKSCSLSESIKKEKFGIKRLGEYIEKNALNPFIQIPIRLQSINKINTNFTRKSSQQVQSLLYRPIIAVRSTSNQNYPEMQNNTASISKSASQDSLIKEVPQPTINIKSAGEQYFSNKDVSNIKIPSN